MKRLATKNALFHNGVNSPSFGCAAHNSMNLTTQADPIISVIIPNYYRTLKLQRSIQSVVNQIYSDFEILVIDDAANTDSLVNDKPSPTSMTDKNRHRIL
jgi:hypothetical protein